MTKLYANIGSGHENDWDLLQQRIITAAQCNADAVIINKSTPHLMIPEEKRYVALDTPWGTLPYIEVAKRSELSKENSHKIVDFCDEIGIPLIWSITDSTAGDFIRDLGSTHTVKLHNDAIDTAELLRYCKDNFVHTICNIKDYELVTALYGIKPAHKEQYSLYYTTESFPPAVEEMKLNTMDQYINDGFNIGYEGREAGIFPTLALGYKGVDFIEKYIGEEDSDNPSILTPAQFYDLFNSLYVMEQASGEITE